jgi:hypothetical protein
LVEDRSTGKERRLSRRGIPPGAIRMNIKGEEMREKEFVRI